MMLPLDTNLATCERTPAQLNIKKTSPLERKGAEMNVSYCIKCVPFKFYLWLKKIKPLNDRDMPIALTYNRT